MVPGFLWDRLLRWHLRFLVHRWHQLGLMVPLAPRDRYFHQRQLDRMDPMVLWVRLILWDH